MTFCGGGVGQGGSVAIPSLLRILAQCTCRTLYHFGDRARTLQRTGMSVRHEQISRFQWKSVRGSAMKEYL